MKWIDERRTTTGNASYSRTLAYNGRFSYLSPEDRYATKPPESNLNLALIGAGLMGLGHITSTQVEGRATVSGLYDTHQGSIEAALALSRQLNPSHEPAVYKNIDEALHDKTIDGYIVATPNYTHADILEKTLEAGKPIYLEKPMATTVADAARIVHQVRASGTPVQVGLQYRFKPIYVPAIEEAHNRKSLGNLKTIGIREHRIPFLDKVGQWNKFNEFSGGTLVEKCCHYFDLFNYFAGAMPSRVFATGSQAASYTNFTYKNRKADIIDSAYVVVEYENGVRAVFDLCMFAPLFFEELVICGDGGRLRCYEQEDFRSKESYESGFELYRGEHFPILKSSPAYQGIIGTLGHSGADYFAKAAFINLINGDNQNAATVEEGYWSVVVGAAAEESLRTGAPVEVDKYIESVDGAI